MTEAGEERYRSGREERVSWLILDFEEADPEPFGGPVPRRPVRLVTRPGELEALCAELLRRPVVGLDVETTLDARTLCLVQVAVPAFNAVIDVFEVGSLAPLASVFACREVMKVIHNASFERRVLGRCGFPLENVFDTLTASRRVRGRRLPSGHSLLAVCRRELGITLAKVHQRSDWRRRPLSSEQLKYAAMDAEVLLDLYRIFRDPA